MKCRTSWILMDGILCFKDKTGENIPFEIRKNPMRLGFRKSCFKDKTGKNIPLENRFYFKSLDSWDSEFYVSRAKPPKIFRLKTEKIRCVWDSENYVSMAKPAKIFRLKTGFISKVWIFGIQNFMFQGQNRRKYSVKN